MGTIIGYAASCGIVVMDEVADLNERVDVRMEEVEEDVGTLKGEVVELRNKLRELREAHGRLSRQVGELNTLAEDMQRHLCLPRTPEERVAARIKANLRAAEQCRELDEVETTDSEWERHALWMAERRAVRRASTLVRFQGRLVPIGELDCAESCENYAVIPVFFLKFSLFIARPPVLGTTLNCIIMPHNYYDNTWHVLMVKIPCIGYNS